MKGRKLKEMKVVEVKGDLQVKAIGGGIYKIGTNI